MDSYFNYTMLTLEYFHWDIFLLTMQLADFVRFAYAIINHIKCAQLCQRQKSASPDTTLVWLSLPHSAATSAPGDIASATTLVQPSMPHSAVACASELPSQALDQARQVNQLLANVGTNETQIEASSRNPEILPCVPKLKQLKKYAISSKRQCSLFDLCTKTVCNFVFCFLIGGGEGDLFFIILGENCTSVFTLYKKYIDDEK